jgi:hypothetical protein
MPASGAGVRIAIRVSIGASIDGNAGALATTRVLAVTVANASKSRRSRKRRPDTAGVAPGSEPKPRQKAPLPPTSTLGERPRPPWYPWPLSEILIVVGAIGTIVGLRGEASKTPGVHGTAPLVAGLIAVGLGVFEVTLREHLSGYRSHALILALLPVLVFHTVIVVGVSAIASPSQLLTILLLPVDVVLYVLLFKLLRARFLDARQLRAVGRR